MPAEPLGESGSKKLLVFADTGWGKTRLLGTSKGKGLLVRPPVEHVDSILARDRPRWEQWKVGDWNDMEEVEDELRLSGKKYDWVWLDSVSSFQDIGLDDLWDTIIHENPRRKRHGLDKGDYGINMQRLGRWVRNIVSLSDQGLFNFGMTAWPTELNPSPDDPERTPKLMPWVQGKNMASKLCGYMNMVAFGDVTDRGTRVLYFMETDRYYAYTKFDEHKADGSFAAANYKILNPTMDKIITMADISAYTSSNGKRPRRKATNVRRRTAK